jgi:hypothetical protein
MSAQVLQCVTIISACVPYLRPFLEAFPSGMLQSDEIRRRGLNYLDISHGFGVNDSRDAGAKIYTLRNLEESQISRSQGVLSVPAVGNIHDGSMGTTSINIEATTGKSDHLIRAEGPLSERTIAVSRTLSQTAQEAL